MRLLAQLNTEYILAVATISDCIVQTLENC
jgi:hypothetical protein